MTKEQQEEEFKRRFGDNPTFNQETCIELLKFCSEVEDITRWNEWRRENPEVMIILSEADLKGATLIDADLNRAILIKAHLEGAIMYKAQLYKAILTGAFLQGVDLGNAILEGADLNGANLGKASIDMQTNPYNSNRDFDDDVEKEKQACLNNANLKGAVLANANLQGADLIGAHLEKSSLLDKKTNLNNANLEAADLSSAIFENANLREANLKDAKLINTNLKNAILRKANLKDANLWEVDLEDADLRYAVLQGASISGSKDRKINLKGADFTGAIVNSETIIQECYIDEKTDFTSVDLDSIRIDPPLLLDLKTNIRRIAWSRYYKEEGKTFAEKIKAKAINCFWWFSDYGSSIHRIIWAIPITALFFTVLYIFIAAQEPDIFTNIDLFNRMPQFKVPLWRQLISVFYFAITSTVPLWLFVIFKFFCFSLVTMVTLGFGGINVATVYDNLSISFVALCLVTFNIIAGYIYISLLVIQLGNFLQSLPSRLNRTRYQEKSKAPKESEEPEKNDNK